MWGFRGEVEEDRLGLSALGLDEAHGLSGFHVGAVVLRVRAVSDHVAVVVHPVVVVTPVLERGQVAVPVVPPRRDVALAGAAGIGVGVLADEGRAVAGALEPGGDGRGLARLEGGEAPVGRLVVADAVVVRVLPGQDRGARWGAERLRRVEAGEAQSRLRELLQPRHALGAGYVEVVREDEHDVRAGRRRRGCRHGRRGRRRAPPAAAGGQDERRERAAENAPGVEK